MGSRKLESLTTKVRGLDLATTRSLRRQDPKIFSRMYNLETAFPDAEPSGSLVGGVMNRTWGRFYAKIRARLAQA